MEVADLIGKVKIPQCHPLELAPFLRSVLYPVQNGIPGVMVEIGTNKGKSLACLLQTLNLLGQRREVFCIDPFDNAARFFPSRVEKFAGEIPAQLIRLSSQDPEAVKRLKGSPIAWLLIDGCHCYDCVLADIDRWIPEVISGGTVVFHDFCPRFNYGKRDFCAAAGSKRRWGVWPAFKIAKAARALEQVEQSPRRTPGMAVFMKV